MVAFSDATCVVGNLGAGLTNIAFAPQGVKLLALATEFMHDDFYWDLMAHKQGPYFCLHGKATKPEMGMYSDFEIDIAKFVGLLDETEQFA
jgi:capsular polysaccharide biosynthesis protein